MPKTLQLLLVIALFCPPAFAQQTDFTEEEREQGAQMLIEKGVLPEDWGSLLPADSLGLNAYFSPKRAHRVRISSSQGVVSVLEVPRGTWLNVQADQEVNAGWQARANTTVGPPVFRGDVALRTRRADEVEESDGSALFAVMARSPVEVMLRDVVVEVKAVKLEE